MKIIFLISIFFISLNANAIMIVNAGLNGQSSMPWWTRLSGQVLRPTDTDGYSVATDSSGNFIVAGSTSNGLDGVVATGGSGDMFITKYDSTGTKLWTKILGGGGASLSPRAVTTDTSGNIFAVGSVAGGGFDGNTLTGTSDFFVTKLNSAGTKQWTKELGVMAYFTYGSKVVTDSSGNVYIGGYTSGGLDGNTLTGVQDFFITKYNTSGTKQWTKQLGVASQSTTGLGIASDGTNVFICGNTTGNLDGQTRTGSTDFFVTKYNAAGTKQWTRLLGVASQITYGNSVASDGTNVFVTGQVTGGLDGNSLTGTSDLYLTKYDTSGTKQWTRQLGIATKFAIGNAVSADSSGNAFVTGYTNGGLDGNTLTGSLDFFITKYNSAGTKQWTKQLGVASKSTQGNGVATDASGNAFVAGSTGGGLDGNTLTGNTDFFATKYDSTGAKIFTKQLGNKAPGAVYITGVATDSTGNVFVSGATDGGLDGNTFMGGGQDFFIMKYNSSGTKLWTKELGFTNGSVYSTGIAVDPSGNAFVGGYTDVGLDGNTRIGFMDFFITKYDTSGTKQWTKQLGVASKNTLANGIATDTSGNVFIAGYTNGNLDGNTLVGAEDFFVSKYNSAGTKQWTKQLGVAAAATEAYGVSTDSSGNVFVGGYTGGNLDGNTLAGIQDVFITKYDSAGTKQWTKQLGASGVYVDITSFTTDASGNAFIGGSADGSIDGNTIKGDQDAFVVKYNSAGTKQWSKLNGATGAYTYVYAITADVSGNVYIAGDAQEGLDGNSLKGTNDVFITKYNSSGAKRWTKEFGVSGGYVDTYGVNIDKLGNLYLGGVAQKSIDGQTLTGVSDALLIRYGGN